MSPPLGDAFSIEHKNQFIENNLKIGSVLKFYCKRANKEKRFIVIAEKYDKETLGLVYINTDINQHFFPTPELQALHLPLEFTEEREYITHDCFAACNDFFPYTYEYIAGLMHLSIDTYLGELSENDLNRILVLVKSAKTIKPAKKKEFGLYF